MKMKSIFLNNTLNYACLSLTNFSIMINFFHNRKHPTTMTIQLHPQCLLGIQCNLRNLDFSDLFKFSLNIDLSIHPFFI